MNGLVITLTRHDGKRIGIPKTQGFLVIDLAKSPLSQMPEAKASVSYSLGNAGVIVEHVRESLRQVLNVMPRALHGRPWQHLEDAEGNAYAIQAGVIVGFEEVEENKLFKLTVELASGIGVKLARCTFDELTTLLTATTDDAQPPEPPQDDPPPEKSD